MKLTPEQIMEQTSAEVVARLLMNRRRLEAAILEAAE